MFPDLVANRIPIEPASTRHIDLDPAFLFEHLDGILRKQTAIPFGASVARVGPAFGSQLTGGAISAVSDRLHKLVIELDGLRIGKADALFEESILKAHDAQADRAVTHVGPSGSFGRIKVDVDHVIERSDRNSDCFSKSFK